MILNAEDPFATHLLIQSADKLLIDLAKRHSTGKLKMDWTKFMKPEYKDALLAVHRETYNFLKHADIDHDQTLHVGDIAMSNVLQLGVCIVNYWGVFDELTDHMKLGFAVARIVFPDGFVLEDQRAEFDAVAFGLKDFTLREFISLWAASDLAKMLPKFEAERTEDLRDVGPFFDRLIATTSNKAAG